MAASQNKGLQFFVTMVVFLLLFFGFYYFISNREKKDGATTADFEVAYINDGSAYISGNQGRKSQEDRRRPPDRLHPVGRRPLLYR